MERRVWLTWAVGKEVADKIYDNIENSETSKQQCHFISGSFVWNSTKEGYDYWRDIHVKIKTYLNEKINPQLISFLKEKDLWNKFIDNFNPPCEQDSYGLGDSFLWSASEEGHDFWSDIADDYNCYQDNEFLSLTKKSKDNENQLQGKEELRGERGESGRSGVCCEGDESRFRLSYTQHRKRIDFQKMEVGDFKVNIPSRHPVLL